MFRRTKVCSAVLVAFGGTLALGADGAFTYTPAENYYGVDSFAYHANDGTASSNTATVFLTGASVNDAPAALRQEGGGALVHPRGDRVPQPTRLADRGVALEHAHVGIARPVAFGELEPGVDAQLARGAVLGVDHHLPVAAPLHGRRAMRAGARDPERLGVEVLEAARHDLVRGARVSYERDRVG